MTDQPTTVRAGEEIDSGKLRVYLSETLHQSFQSISITQFPGGFSNLTYLIKAGTNEFVLRKPPIGANIKSAHDMSREFRVLTLLRQAGYSKVPEVVHLCEDESIIGQKFYIMKRVNGVILRNRIPKDLTISPDTFLELSKSTIDGLVDLHNLNLQSNGLDQLGKTEGYVKRQVDGWIQRYENSKTDTIDSMDQVSEWLKKNLPIQEFPAFIHNDYKYDNLVLDENDLTNIKAVLDWEMATVGDPWMDLGTTLAYWAEPTDSDALKPFSLTWIPGNMSRSEALRYYQEKSGRQVENFIFYYAFGAFKIGVICQQIYYRFKKGLTQDPRFGSLIHVIRACGENARRAIDTFKI
jgi:aminoglycoside phosphotransferase (APT) family kinase protein